MFSLIGVRLDSSPTWVPLGRGGVEGLVVEGKVPFDRVARAEEARGGLV